MPTIPKWFSEKKAYQCLKTDEVTRIDGTYQKASRMDFQATEEAFSPQKRTSRTSKHEFSYFCPPGCGSWFRIRIQIHWSDWIWIQSGSETLVFIKECMVHGDSLWTTEYRHIPSHSQYYTPYNPFHLDKCHSRDNIASTSVSFGPAMVLVRQILLTSWDEMNYSVCIEKKLWRECSSQYKGRFFH